MLHSANTPCTVEGLRFGMMILWTPKKKCRPLNIRLQRYRDILVRSFWKPRNGVKCQIHIQNPNDGVDMRLDHSDWTIHACKNSPSPNKILGTPWAHAALFCGPQMDSGTVSTFWVGIYWTLSTWGVLSLCSAALWQNDEVYTPWIILVMWMANGPFLGWPWHPDTKQWWLFT